MNLQLDYETLFKQIDEYRLGYVSTNMLQKYLVNNCAYKINEGEISYILNRYDKDGDYRISMDEFRNEVAAGEMDEEEQEMEGEEQNEG